MTRTRLMIAVALAQAISLGGCSRREELPFYRTAELTPEWLTAREGRVPSMHHVASFRMVDQQGVDVTEHAFEGKATIVGFFFTTCADICPTTTANIHQLLNHMPNEPRIQVLSYSVAPERDSVSALRRFAEHHQISDQRWHFLTGERTVMERLARESYFTIVGDARNTDVTSLKHTESVRLVDARGRLRGVYAAMLPFDMQRLEEDLALLIAEQADDSAR